MNFSSVCPPLSYPVNVGCGAVTMSPPCQDYTAITQSENRESEATGKF